MPLMRLAIFLYRSPKRVCLQGFIGSAIFPSRDVGAGCLIAMWRIQVHTYQPVAQYSLRNPLAPLGENRTASITSRASDPCPTCEVNTEMASTEMASSEWPVGPNQP